MKTLKELKGAKELSKNDQKALNGGKRQCRQTAPYCPVGSECINGVCERILID